MQQAPALSTSCISHCLQELAHLYHYYLHGEQGNRDGGGKKERLPNGEPFPDIVLRYQVGVVSNSSFEAAGLAAADSMLAINLLLHLLCNAVAAAGYNKLPVPPIRPACIPGCTDPQTPLFYRCTTGGCTHRVAAAPG